MVNDSRPSKFHQYAVTNIPIQPKMPTCYSFCFIPNCRMRARSYCSDWFTSHLVFRCPSNCLHLVTCQGIFRSYWQIRAYYIALISLCNQFERFLIKKVWPGLILTWRSLFTVQLTAYENLKTCMK